MSPFAHLASHGAGANVAGASTTPSADADPENKDPDSEGDQEGEGGKKGKKSKRAEETDGEDPDGTDDDDEDDEKDPKARAIRMRERGRCAAIFRSAAAGRNPAAAAEIAFGTSMTRTAAVNLLRTVAPAASAQQEPAPAADQAGYAALRTRMQAEGQPPVNPQGGGQSDERPGARMVRLNHARMGDSR
ncbi:hypothetical protein WG31_09305 [Acetobacter oryzifermentans]|uniref:Uncharacterized protein n=1 Tax=Acetobacter oryzifermentans TaxID=1633874 RepID=A0ABN4NSV3_9PROT|nr:hypothetical protein WG31_09305 [Acetobacter oryzifermentans]